MISRRIGLNTLEISSGSLKCLGQCYSNKHTFAKERMSVVQVLLVIMSLRYCQIIWSGPRAETLEQVLSASYISNIENSTPE